MDLAAHCRDLWDHAKRYDDEEDRLYGLLVAFVLDHEHYSNDRGFRRETRRIQPKTPLLFDLVRHKVASLVTPPIRIRCRPQRQLTDMAAAELSQRLIEQTVRDPMRRYRINRTKAVWGAIGAGRGVMWLSWEAGIGPRFENVDARTTHVAPGWTDHHDPCCPWVGREMMVTKQWLESTGWHVPKDLQPSEQGKERDGQHFRNPDEPGSVDVGEVVPLYRIVRQFFRDDPRGGKRADIPLPRDEWHMAGPQGDIPVPVEVDAAEFAMSMPDATLVISKPAPRYKRLCVVFYADYKGSDGIAWEGDWTDGAANEVEGPFPFPVLIMGSYLHPLRATGLNDTYINQTAQMLDNGTMRQAWEQTRQVNTLIVMEKGALKGEDGHDFVLTDAPVQVAIAADSAASETTKIIQAGSINPGIAQIRDMVAQTASRFGTGDVPMPANRSRDIAGVTMQAMQQMGDLPLELHKKDLDDEESMLFTALLCFERAYRTEPELIQFQQEDGQTTFIPVRGADLSPMRVVVGDHDGQRLDAEQVQAVAQFVGQIAVLPGGLQMMAVLAKDAGFSESTAQKMQQMASAVAPPIAGEAQPVR